MQLKSDEAGLNDLYIIIESFFEKRKKMKIFVFYCGSECRNKDDIQASIYVCMLIEGKYLFRYGVTNDGKPGYDRWISSLAQGVGPMFYYYDKFFSEEATYQFASGTTPEDIRCNLELLDEYLKEQGVDVS